MGKKVAGLRNKMRKVILYMYIFFVRKKISLNLVFCNENIAFFIGLSQTIISVEVVCNNWAWAELRTQNEIKVEVQISL